MTNRYVWKVNGAPCARADVEAYLDLHGATLPALKSPSAILGWMERESDAAGQELCVQGNVVRVRPTEDATPDPVDYQYPRDVVKEQPPLVSLQWTDKWGQRWRGRGVNFRAIRDSFAEAAVTGSVGDVEEMDQTRVGGCCYLVAEVHKLNDDGTDRVPK